MTLVAYEATKQGDELIQKYGIEKATSYQDLERKLSELYGQVPDKIAYERELAEIHPHKKWLLKYIEPKIKEVKVEVPVPAPLEIKSNADGLADKSAGNSVLQQAPMSSTDYIAIMGIIGVVGVLSLSLIIAAKAK